jgi:hypothetical protein
VIPRIPSKQDRLEEDKYGGNGKGRRDRLGKRGGYSCPEQGIPEDKNRKIQSETISGQNQSQRLVYKYNESDMGPFRVLIDPVGSDPRNKRSVVDIGRMVGKLDINYRRIF